MGTNWTFKKHKQFLYENERWPSRTWAGSDNFSIFFFGGGGRALVGSPERACLSPEGSACSHKMRGCGTPRTGEKGRFCGKAKGIGWIFHEWGPGECKSALDQDAETHIDWLSGSKRYKDSKTKRKMSHRNYRKIMWAAWFLYCADTK